ncbi:MAG: N-acetylmuramoyl-L-alanine amidase [Pyrinomonadaceae bacterium]
MPEKMRIVLDPGHGGNALVGGSTPNNAVGVGGLLEKDLTLEIARMAAARLNSKGYPTFLTRSDDRNLSPEDRAGKMREAGADVFVSIHFNASRNPETDGTEVFISGASGEKDRKLAETLLLAVPKAASVDPLGVRRADFTVLKGDQRLAKTAACLIEMAYLSNPRQAEKLRSRGYLENLAGALAGSLQVFADDSAQSRSMGMETPGEQLISETVREHSDPKNFPIDLPEPGKGTDVISFSVPPELKFSRWELETTAVSAGAGYKVVKGPRPGTGGNRKISVDWWHPPYGKINYKLKVYASPDGRTGEAERILFDSPGWLEKARDQISQGVPLSLAVKGEKAKQIFEAIQKYQSLHSGKQTGDVAVAMEPVTITVVILVGIVIFGILVALGLITLGTIIKMALDKGYNVKDTKFKAAVGEGQLKQEHEIAFNLTRPEKNAATSPAQGFSLGLDDELDERHFQPLEAVGLDGNPVFDIGESVGKSGKNKEADILAVKKRLISLGYDWLTPDKTVSNVFIAAIKLFQTIISGKNSISGDGRIDVGGNTFKWLGAINAPRWQTMPAGSAAEGFFNFELTDTADKHDFGTDWMADAIKAAGGHYRDNYLKAHPSAALLTVNDVSLPHGGDTPDHAGHEAGLACDLQLPRTDGKAGGINLTKTSDLSLYDRDAARAVLQALRAQTAVSRIFLNDNVLIKEGLCVWADGHDHHIHFEIKPPDRGAVETDGMGYYHSGGMLYQGSRQDDIDYRTFDVGCTNSAGIKRGEKFVEFGAMGITSDRPNKKENVFLRWCDIPKNRCEIDVVIHFHGWNITKEKRFFDFAVKNSGLDLLKPDGSLTRKRPTLCILPFGLNDPDYQVTINGKTVDRNHPGRYVFPFFYPKDGLQKLIDFSFDHLTKLFNSSFTQGRLILTAHSGGGAAVSNLLGNVLKGNLNLKAKNFDEIHLFDSTYEWQQNTISWADKKIDEDLKIPVKEIPLRAGALRVLYLPLDSDCKVAGTVAGSRKIEGELSKKLGKTSPLNSRYRVQATRVEHLAIPKTFGYQLLADAGTDLDDSGAKGSFQACCVKEPAKCGVWEKAKQQSLGPTYEEADYFAESEKDFLNY